MQVRRIEIYPVKARPASFAALLTGVYLWHSILPDPFFVTPFLPKMLNVVRNHLVATAACAVLLVFVARFFARGYAVRRRMRKLVSINRNDRDELGYRSPKTNANLHLTIVWPASFYAMGPFEGHGRSYARSAYSCPSTWYDSRTEPLIGCQQD